MKQKNRLLFPALITTALTATSLSAFADGTWSAGAAGTWNTTATNWTGVSGTPWDSSNGPSNTAIFNDTTNATISGTVYAAGLTFGGATTTNTLTAGTLDFGSANAPINLTNNAKLTINSTLAGSGNLTFTSVANGDWDRGVTLGADNSSTFTGKMSFVKTAGNYFFVKVTSDLSFGAVPASFTADALTFNTVNFASNVTIAANRGINLAGTLNFTGGTQTINSVISGSGGLFIQGATVTLNAVNTYAGNTAGRQGTYNIGIDNALPHGAGKGVVNLDGRGVATLDLKGHELTVNALDFNNFNTFASTVDNTAAGTASLILGDGNGSGTLRTGSLIKNTGGALSMTKIGTGTQTFNTANTYNGNTTVNGGTLALGNVNAIQNSTLDTGTSGSQAVTFTVAGTNTYNIGGLAGADELAIGGNTVSVGSNNANTNYSGNLSGTGGALTKTGNGILTMASTNGYTGATNVNGGKLTIASGGNINSTSAVSIGAGEFNYNSSTALSKAVTFSGTGGKLSGSGTISQAVNITTGNTLAIGNSPGTMNFGSTLGLNGTTVMEIDGTSGAGVTGGYDFANLTGAGAAGVITYGGALTLDMGAIFTTGSYSWNLFDFASETGTFSTITLTDQYSGSLLDGDSNGVWDLIDGDNTWQFTESTGVLGLTVIPEPNAAALLGGLGLLCLLRRRR